MGHGRLILWLLICLYNDGLHYKMLDRSFILATSAIRLITMVPACLLGLTQVKVTLKSCINPAQTCWTLIGEFN